MELLVIPLLVVLVSAILLKFLIVKTPEIGYDPHKTRELELEVYGEAITKCEDKNCVECYILAPKALIPPRGSGGVSIMKKNTSTRRRIKEVQGYTVNLTNTIIPDYAHAVVVPDSVGIVYIYFTWTDKATGNPMGAKVIPAEQFVPKATYHVDIYTCETCGQRKAYNGHICAVCRKESKSHKRLNPLRPVPKSRWTMCLQRKESKQDYIQQGDFSD